MQANLEVLEGLVRRLDISVPMDQLEAEVQSRLKHMARNVKMDGFRPGKAPLSAVARQHGAGVRQEVLGETLKTRFGDAVQTYQLKIAGYPRFEPKAGQTARVRLIKKHQRKTQQNPNGAILEREGTIHISNVMLASKFDARAEKRGAKAAA